MSSKWYLVPKLVPSHITTVGTAKSVEDLRQHVKDLQQQVEYQRQQVRALTTQLDQCKQKKPSKPRES